MTSNNKTQRDSLPNHSEPPPGVSLLDADELRDIERWMLTGPGKGFSPEAIGLRLPNENVYTVIMATIFFLITGILACGWLYGDVDASTKSFFLILGSATLFFACIMISVVLRREWLVLDRDCIYRLSRTLAISRRQRLEKKYISRVECSCMDNAFDRVDRIGRLYTVSVLTVSPGKGAISLHASRDRAQAEWVARLAAKKLDIAISGNIKGLSPLLVNQAIAHTRDGSSQNGMPPVEWQRTLPENHQFFGAGDPELCKCAIAAGSRNALYAVRKNYMGLFLPLVFMFGSLVFCLMAEALKARIIGLTALIISLGLGISAGAVTVVFEPGRMIFIRNWSFLRLRKIIDKRDIKGIVQARYIARHKHGKRKHWQLVLVAKPKNVQPFAVENMASTEWLAGLFSHWTGLPVSAQVGRYTGK